MKWLWWTLAALWLAAQVMVSLSSHLEWRLCELAKTVREANHDNNGLEVTLAKVQSFGAAQRIADAMAPKTAPTQAAPQPEENGQPRAASPAVFPLRGAPGNIVFPTTLAQEPVAPLLRRYGY